MAVLAGEGVPEEGRGLRWAGLYRRCLRRAGSREKEGLRARSRTVVEGAGLGLRKGSLLREAIGFFLGPIATMYLLSGTRKTLSEKRASVKELGSWVSALLVVLSSGRKDPQNILSGHFVV